METKKVMSASVKLTENKFEYILLVLDGETSAAAIWPNELDQMLKQDESICMNMLGLEKFCLVLKGAEVEVEKTTEGEGDAVVHIIKSIKIDDSLGIVGKAVEAFIKQMLG